MKEVKPIIKSQNRVRSMFAFMKEENAEPSDFVDVDLKEKEEEIQNVEDVQKVEEIQPQDNVEVKEPQNDGPVVLKRGRGNNMVDKSQKQSITKVIEERKKPSKIVKVDSVTYDGKPKEKVKMTFALWWKNLWLKVRNWWDIFIQKKGAMRFVIMLGVMIVLMVGIVIYSFATKTHFNDLFQSKTSAFVLNQDENSGQGYAQTISLKEFTKSKATDKNTESFQYIDFYGKDIDKTKSLQSLNFVLKTAFDDLTINISLEIYYGETSHLKSQPKRVDLNKNVAKFVELSIDQGIKFDDTTVFRIIFDSVKTSDLNDILETPYDVDFSVYSLGYRN